MHTACTPQVQINRDLSLAAIPVRRPRRKTDRRSFSTGLTLLNLTTWVYALASSGVALG